MDKIESKLYLFLKKCKMVQNIYLALMDFYSIESFKVDGCDMNW